MLSPSCENSNAVPDASWHPKEASGEDKAGLLVFLLQLIEGKHALQQLRSLQLQL